MGGVATARVEARNNDGLDQRGSRELGRSDRTESGGRRQQYLLKDGIAKRERKRGVK